MNRKGTLTNLRKEKKQIQVMRDSGSEMEQVSGERGTVRAGC